MDKKIDLDIDPDKIAEIVEEISSEGGSSAKEKWKNVSEAKKRWIVIVLTGIALFFLTYSFKY